MVSSRYIRIETKRKRREEEAKKFAQESSLAESINFPKVVSYFESRPIYRYVKFSDSEILQIKDKSWNVESVARFSSKIYLKKLIVYFIRQNPILKTKLQVAMNGVFHLESFYTIENLANYLDADDIFFIVDSIFDGMDVSNHVKSWFGTLMIPSRISIQDISREDLWKGMTKNEFIFSVSSGLEGITIDVRNILSV